MKHPFLYSMIACGTLPLTLTSAPKTQVKPNVVIIYADDIGYGDFSCNGATRISTPNVDRLAAAGVRFTNAHSTSATSTPSRFGLLTGKYPWRVEGTGIAPGDAGMIIPPQTYTLADLMHESGYRTAAVGKWHLGLGESQKQDWNGTISPGLSDLGFDYSFIIPATGDRVPCVFLENQRVYQYDPSAPISVSYKENFPGEPTGKDNPELLRLHPSHGHDMSIVNGISRIGFMKGGGKALWVDENIAGVITHKACNFIKENKDRPFFLYFGTHDIHVPRVPNKRFAGKSLMGARGDAILSFDWTVGEIIRELEQNGILQNTMIILSSDNGPVLNDGYKDQAVELVGDHKPWSNLRGGKGSAFEAGTRIPMIITGPNLKQGLQSDALLSQIDLFRSLGRLCNTRIPEGAAPDSKDMLAAFMGKDQKGRSWLVEQNAQSTLSILDAAGFKYIEPSQKPSKHKNTLIELGNLPSPQLYNLKKDIGEQHNLIDSLPGKRDELSALLDKIKKGTVTE